VNTFQGWWWWWETETKTTVARIPFLRRGCAILVLGKSCHR
jgi:hypothetical protein